MIEAPFNIKTGKKHYTLHIIFYFTPSDWVLANYIWDEWEKGIRILFFSVGFGISIEVDPKQFEGDGPLDPSEDNF